VTSILEKFVKFIKSVRAIKSLFYTVPQ